MAGELGHFKDKYFKNLSYKIKNFNRLCCLAFVVSIDMDLNIILLPIAHTILQYIITYADNFSFCN